MLLVNCRGLQCYRCCAAFWLSCPASIVVRRNGRAQPSAVPIDGATPQSVSPFLQRASSCQPLAALPGPQSAACAPAEMSPFIYYKCCTCSRITQPEVLQGTVWLESMTYKNGLPVSVDARGRGRHTGSLHVACGQRCQHARVVLAKSPHKRSSFMDNRLHWHSHSLPAALPGAPSS